MIKNKEKLYKIGNSIIYLLDDDSNVSLTKILIYVYLLDENSVRKGFTTFFNLNYYCGIYPVNAIIYFDLSTNLILLGEYISKNNTHGKYVKLKEFNDDNFSGWDMIIMDEIILSVKNKSDEELISLFEGDCLLTRTKEREDEYINLIDLLEGDKRKQGLYKQYNEVINW